MRTPIYKIIRTTHQESVAAEKDILRQVAECELTPIRVVFFSAIDTNEEYTTQLKRISHLTNEIFGERKPMIALVAQAPLDGNLVAEATFVEGEAGVCYHEEYITIDNEMIFTCGIISSLEESIGNQAEAVFSHIDTILKQEGYAISDIVRQWNFIEQITHISPQGQHYQQFNDARSRFYEGAEWHNGYPAATGIGTKRGGVMVMLVALRNSTKQSRPIDNPLQQSAHAYSQRVLIEGSSPNRKTTPKFERARWVGEKEQMIYISGTAAIRGEESLLSDLLKQTAITMENIDQLISHNSQLQHNIPTIANYGYEVLRVYLKQTTDWQEVKHWLEKNYNCEQTIYLEADICREELLIEIESIAKPEK